MRLSLNNFDKAMFSNQRHVQCLKAVKHDNFIVIYMYTNMRVPQFLRLKKLISNPDNSGIFIKTALY